MKAICKIKLSKNHNLLENLFSFYTIFLVYKQDEKEILKVYKIYEDELINQIINKNIYKNLIFYKYKDSFHISIIENDTIYNFIIKNFDEWINNYF